MAYEVITLNLIPSGDVPVIHAAQYDKNRPLNFALKLGDDDFNPSGYNLELQIRKVDNNIVTVAPSVVNNNVVTFLSTEQMTACSGTNLGEIQITKDALDIATLHFYLVVQRDVLAGGMTSTSDIHNLEEQIEELLPEALGDQYYTKDQTNTLLDGKADVSDIPDMSNYYQKSETYSSSEVNTLLSAKADTSALATVATTGNYNDLSNKPTIPAAQVNSDWNAESGVAMILNKPTIPDAQVQSDWNQADNTKVDYIKNKPTIPTIVTATIQNVAIATFPDGADNVPVKSLKVDIDANLSGVSSVNVYRMGKNLFNKNGNLTASYFIGSSGALTYSAGWNTTDYELIKQGDYTMSGETASGAYYAICWYDEDKTYISGYQKFTQNATSVTIPSNAKYVRYSVHDTALDTFQLEIGNTATTYEPYNGTTYPISLGETLTQGGVLDVTTGLLTRTDETTSQLTPTQVKTLLGNNNIFADSGNVNELVYFKTGCESIARLIEAYM